MKYYIIILMGPEVQTSTVRTDKDCGSVSAQERQRMTIIVFPYNWIKPSLI